MYNVNVGVKNMRYLVVIRQAIFKIYLFAF